MSKSLTLNKSNLVRIAEVVLWSGVSGAVVALADQVSLIEFPVMYAFAVPVVNSALYALKEFVGGQID